MVKCPYPRTQQSQLNQGSCMYHWPDQLFWDTYWLVQSGFEVITSATHFKCTTNWATHNLGLVSSRILAFICKSWWHKNDFFFLKLWNFINCSENYNVAEKSSHTKTWILGQINNTEIHCCMSFWSSTIFTYSAPILVVWKSVATINEGVYHTTTVCKMSCFSISMFNCDLKICTCWDSNCFNLHVMMWF